MNQLIQLLEEHGCTVDRIDAETLGVTLPSGDRIILQAEEV